MAGPVHAQQPIISTANFTIAGTVFQPQDPCRPAGDSIPLNGTLHLLTQVSITSTATTIRVLTNLDDAVGIGGTTGFIYHATGAIKSLTQIIPPNPVSPQNFFGEFDLIPASACPPTTVPVTGRLAFNPDGSLDVHVCADDPFCSTWFVFGTAP